MEWKAKDQRAVVEKIHRQGMTVNGWARTRGFSVDTVKNALYRGVGRGSVGPVVAKVQAKLREEGLA